MRSNAKKVMQRLQNKFERAKREAPRILSNEGQNYFNKEFREQQHDGRKWAEVDRRKPGTFAYKYAKPRSLRNNPILVGKTRRLKNALNRASAAGSASVSRIKWVLAGVPYAVYHNDGIGQKKRTFMSASTGLGKALKRKFEQVYRSNLK
jgi:hypothetical protein